MGAGNLVELVGRGRPHGWYAAADALLLPSSYEAFSLVMLEAAAAGLPLLVPRINGAEELVREGINGWFVPPAAEQIAERLRELAADPARLGDGKREPRGGTPFRLGAGGRPIRAAVRGARGVSGEGRLRVTYLDHMARLSGAEIALVRLLRAAGPGLDATVILAEDGGIGRPASAPPARGWRSCP